VIVQRPVGCVLLVPSSAFVGQLFTRPASQTVGTEPVIRSAISHADLGPTPPAASDAQQETVTTESEDEAIVDLYGNEVTDAVAKYKLDAAGSLYELHSPRTEVPRLTAPKG